MYLWQFDCCCDRKISPQHQTSTAPFLTCGRNRATPALPCSLLHFPTSTPKPRAEGSSPSAPAKNSATAFAVALFFVTGRNVLATRHGCAPRSACRGASACRWHASYEPTEAAGETSPSAPAKNRRKHCVSAGFLFPCVVWSKCSHWFRHQVFASVCTCLQPLSSPPAPKTHPVSPFSG